MMLQAVAERRSRRRYPSRACSSSIFISFLLMFNLLPGSHPSRYPSVAGQRRVNGSRWIGSIRQAGQASGKGERAGNGNDALVGFEPTEAKL